MTLRQRWKQTSLPNKLLIGTGAAVAFGTLFYAGAALWQVHILNKSAEQTEKQNERMIAASEQIASATVEALREAKRSNEEIANRAEKLIETNKSLVDSGRTSARAGETTARAAEQSARFARQSFTISEAPYLRIGDFKITEELPDKGGNVSIGFQNAGKTPAIELRVKLQGSLRDKDIPEDFSLNESQWRGPIEVPPGHTHTYIVHYRGLSGTESLNVKTGKQRLYVYGMLQYKDRFETAYAHKFCAKYDVEARVFEMCSTYNSLKQQ
jgi:hypothetical protein